MRRHSFGSAMRASMPSASKRPRAGFALTAPRGPAAAVYGQLFMATHSCIRRATTTGPQLAAVSCRHSSSAHRRAQLARRHLQMTVAVPPQRFVACVAGPASKFRQRQIRLRRYQRHHLRETSYGESFSHTNAALKSATEVPARDVKAPRQPIRANPRVREMLVHKQKTPPTQLGELRRSHTATCPAPRIEFRVLPLC